MPQVTWGYKIVQDNILISLWLVTDVNEEELLQS